MVRTIIVLPDGTEISSGAKAGPAIVTKNLTQMVNDGTELSIGSVCSSMFEAKIISTDGSLTINEGSDINVFEVDTSGTRSNVGLFRVEKPSRSTAHTFKITAYDHVTKLDKDVTAWFNALDAWPYTLFDFASLLCTECGLVLKNTSIPNGDRLIQKFSASGIIGRQLMKYIGQVCCRFGRATVDGEFEFSWYSSSGRTVTVNDYYLNGLSFEDYVTHPIERVQIKATESDIGTIYPQDTDGTNTYVIEGNPLLTASSPEDLLGVTETVFNELKSISYTPCKCTLFYPSGVSAGDIIKIATKNGTDIDICVMKSTLKGQKQTIECYGSYRRDSVSLKNNESIVDPLYGKMLELEKNVEGVSVRVTDLQTESEREIAAVSVKTDGISAEVTNRTQELENLRIDISKLQVSSDNVSVLVQQIIEEGTTKLINALGLRIDGSSVDIHRPGGEMTNSLNETGMYVIRAKGEPDETVMLQANADGVIATDVTVRNYLVIGSHARIEDYVDEDGEEGTACYWID